MRFDDVCGMRIASLLLLVGCTSSMTNEPSEPCEVRDVTGSVPGVSITIQADSCVVLRGHGINFQYSVTTTAEVPAIAVPATSSCDCSRRSTQISSWTGWIINGMTSGGESQQYCLCDTGCCAPQGASTIQPEIGVFDDEVQWSGRTWNGPSDTGQGMGDYFDAGTYAFRVGFAGYGAGSVSAELAFTVVDL